MSRRPNTKEQGDRAGYGFKGAILGFKGLSRVKKRFFERPASFRTCGLHEGVSFARALGFGFASRELALLLGGEQRRDLVNSCHDARAGVSSHSSRHFTKTAFQKRGPNGAQRSEDLTRSQKVDKDLPKIKRVTKRRRGARALSAHLPASIAA
jgi:hypothetical protein